MYKYILDEHGRPVVCDDLIAWAQWFEVGANRIVRRTEITKTPKVIVSTVFLALDHAFGLDDPPVLWETMIFGGPMDEAQWRYRYRDIAERHHEALVRYLRNFHEDEDPPEPDNGYARLL